MTKERFIKYIPSEKSSWLVVNYPNAFLLLVLIATRARRKNGHIDGLEVGEAIVDHESCGLTRQKYRTALDKLVEFNFIKIIHNGKKFFDKNQGHRKSTIKITIKSILVKLIDDSVWDINSEEQKNESTNTSTNEQPTSNHKQESEEAKEFAFSLKKEANKKKEIAAAHSLFAFSPFLEKENEKAEDSLWVYIKSHLLDISAKTLETWVTKWPYERILANLKLLKIRKPIHHEKWMETALKKDFAEQQRRIDNNRQFAIDLKQAYGWSSLNITKQYCTDVETSKDFSFFLEEKDFQEMLENCYRSKSEIGDA